MKTRVFSLAFGLALVTSTALALPKGPKDVPDPPPSGASAPKPPPPPPPPGSPSGQPGPAPTAPASKAMLPAGEYDFRLRVPSANNLDLEDSVRIMRDGANVVVVLGPEAKAIGAVTPEGNLSLRIPIGPNVQIAMTGKVGPNGVAGGQVQVLKPNAPPRAGTFTLTPESANNGKSVRKKPVADCGFWCKLEKAWSCLKDWSKC
jgi:hypothetical protein